MNKKIKLFFFIDSFRIGGMHRQVLYLVKNINRNDFEPIMCTSTSEGGLKKDFENTNCKMIGLDWKGRFDLGVIKRLIEVLKIEKPDIIFITEAQNLIYYRIANFFVNNKTIQIGSFRGLTFWLGHNKLILRIIDNLLAKLLYKTSKCVVVNSNELKIHYDEIITPTARNPIQIIYNGSDFNFKITKSKQIIYDELGINSSHMLITMVARLDPWKDFYTLIDAADIVIEKYKNAKFLLVGDGKLRTELEMLIEKKNLSDSVLIIGEKKDVFNYINASDISVLSSFGEGFSNSILESMAFSIPVIATNVGGNATVIGNSGESGYLIPPKSPQVFAETILKLINDKKLREQIGKAGCMRIHNLCGIDSYTSNYQKLFKNVLNNYK